MDLLSAASNLQSASILSKVQYAVAAKVMDSQRQSGAAAIQLVQAATQGFETAAQNTVAAAMGLGANLDVYG